MGDKVFSLRNLDMDKVKRLASECGFTTVAEYVRWCIANGPRLLYGNAAQKQDEKFVEK